MPRSSVIVAAFVFAALAPPTALGAAGPSGTAEKVSQSATANARVLEVDGEIFMGDAIKTGASGEAQIRFVDNTRMVVGPNARVTIDKFVYSGSTARSVTLNVVKGAFRFITGKSPKRAYTIRTPVVAVGVRGTGFDGFVEGGSGRTTIALYEGSAQVCTRAGQCTTLRAGCGIVVATPAGFQQPAAATLARLLPYSVSQASLLPAFRLDTSACHGAAAPATPYILRNPNGPGNGTSADGPGRRGGGDRGQRGR